MSVLVVFLISLALPATDAGDTLRTSGEASADGVVRRTI